MGLRDIKIPHSVVEYNGTKIELRGMSFSDLMEIVNTYGPEAAMAFGKIQESGSLAASDVRSVIGSLAKEFPDMVAMAIALASGEYDEDTFAIAKKLPFNVQLECIEAIFHRTFESEADVKKLVESLTRMLTGVSGVLAETELTSLSGIGGSAAA